MRGLMFAVCFALVGAQLFAQSPPRLVPAAGVVRDAAGAPRNGPVVVTFAIYATQEGGEPLWTETQSLTLDPSGQYSTLLGATQPEGLPADLFSQAEARWLAVAVDGGPEGPRSFWASVPYALKAADAETVGGLPLEAFVVNGAYRKPSDASPIPSADADGMPAGAAGLADDPRNELVVPEDLIVQGSTCTGADCVNGESFGFDTLRLKENNTRIQFDDTSTGAFPANNWQIRANSSASGGTNFLGIVDQGATGNSETGTIVFQVEAGAPANALFVDNTGRIGLRTSTPVLDVHAATGNTPAMRLEQNNSGGFTPQTWDIAGNEANFFVRDVTNGSTLPFRIRPGAPSSSIDINGLGRVGIGLGSPVAPLDVRGTATTIGVGNAALKLANAAGDVAFQLDAGANGSFWNVSMRGSDETLVFSKSATGFTEASLDPGGNLTLRGNLTIGGNCSDANGGNGGVDGCDRVFAPDYPLPSIEEHASQMWGNGYLPAVGPTPEDAPWNLGLKAAGMLNELEKAHIYIDQLQRQLKEQQQLFEALKSRLDALERNLQPR
jgi:hypothetical protein